MCGCIRNEIHFIVGYCIYNFVIHFDIDKTVMIYGQVCVYKYLVTGTVEYIQVSTEAGGLLTGNKKGMSFSTSSMV